jgi:hypothetical protein
MNLNGRPPDAEQEQRGREGAEHASSMNMAHPGEIDVGAHGVGAELRLVEERLGSSSHLGRSSDGEAVWSGALCAE